MLRELNKRLRNFSGAVLYHQEVPSNVKHRTHLVTIVFLSLNHYNMQRQLYPLINSNSTNEVTNKVTDAPISYCFHFSRP